MRKRPWSLGLGLLGWGLFGSVIAAEHCEPGAGLVVSVQGDVVISRTGSPRWVPATLRDTLCPGDRIHIEARSRAAVRLANDTILRLDQGTTVTFSKIKPDAPSWLELLRGAVHFLSRVPQRLNIHTPFVNAGIEGTEFVVRVTARATRVFVLEGQVLTSNAAGRLRLSSGEAAVAEAGMPPRRLIVVKPRDAVQWALYYPPLIDYRESAYPTGPDAAALRAALASYRSGDLPAAFAALDAVLPAARDARYHTLRAGLLLTVGRVDEARPAIHQALAEAPDDATAVALQAVIAVAQNETAEALELAKTAARRDPSSPVAQIALSYAYQATFQIENARQSVEKALRLDPDSALAWARLAELWLATGYLDRALEAAERAARLDPKLERTQTVLGFAYLSEINIDEAKAAFEEAIALDPAAPLPRLGLGLAHIRQGKLDEGTEDIETAAMLDPDNALIRSYLGKAYYEQKRGGLAATEFANAKALDPNDPTPWFYDAIYKQTINRPVEALHDMQRAIALNDNRAVYRSRLLLDQDQAARGASLARIYRDLGFQQRALVEGWKSVNTDPANYSAHRLLADTYATLPRHQFARVSELLQAQLLQPINVTPLQPQLGAANLRILEGTGPAEPGFSEFNPLFIRNRAYLQAGGLVGNNATWSDNVILSGVHNKLSGSLGQFHFETDGIRENADQRQDIYNAFVQVAGTPQTSFQAELRQTEIERGDLGLTFAGQFTPTLRHNEETYGGRLGFRYVPRPHSTLIGSLIFQDHDLETNVIPGLFELASDGKGYLGELRYLLDAGPVELTVGAGHLRKNETTQAILGRRPSVESDDADFTNAYLYSYNQIGPQLNLTVGVDADFLRGAREGQDRDQFNPKLGLLWVPFPTTTIRAATFRTLTRPLISEINVYPTVEPTQVAGFNQFFLGTEAAQGDRAWRYGVGLDQVFSTNVYAGAEFSARDQETEVTVFPEGVPAVTHVDWVERLVRSYLYWTPHRWLALSAEYQFENLKRELMDLQVIGAFSALRTHRVPFRIGFFHPSGLTTTLAMTFVDQSGDFVDETSALTQPGSDDFWVADAAVGYRLPKRYGLLTLEIKNLLNEKFRFQDTDPGTPEIIPERMVLFRLSLSI
jgi:tetratricopeptide (TPR) repeat protein